ncbi:MAG: hypothetical protein CMM08_00700 [Rhodospirillaceae bacterium]|jgi:hypothetical protein|nr:hypothetical protein [Rhodospirillaceae bacterium]|tara:strand:+ start:631 stop:819 length:189 start_codon:yes stop_codon:yes gene_type:complete
MTVTAAGTLAFLLGYAISSQTGVEPGYFEASETGGYGAASEEPGEQGADGETQEYYRNLLKD